MGSRIQGRPKRLGRPDFIPVWGEQAKMMAKKVRSGARELVPVPAGARLLTLPAARGYLSVSHWHMYQLVRSGEIQHIVAGRRWLVDRQDLDAWIQKRKSLVVSMED